MRRMSRRHRSYLKNVRRSFRYSITSFSLRGCDSASGNSIADERGTQATSLDSWSISSSPDWISAAYTNVNSCRFSPSNGTTRLRRADGLGSSRGDPPFRGPRQRANHRYDGLWRASSSKRYTQCRFPGVAAQATCSAHIVQEHSSRF